jgi:hypothetical protein
MNFTVYTLCIHVSYSRKLSKINDLHSEVHSVVESHCGVTGSILIKAD